MAQNLPIADAFTAWNLRLLKCYFSEASRGEEVFLRVDGDLLDGIGQDLGGDAGFIEAVRVGPAWRRPNADFVERVKGLVGQRKLLATLKDGDLDDPRRLDAQLRLAGYVDPGALDPVYRGRAAPVYLPYLALLVRIAAASGQEGGFYQNLRETLRLRAPFGSTEMASLEECWTDLERWTAAHHQFGVFKLRKLGGLSRIGVPLSQSILKSGDVQRIPWIFARAELRPDRILDDEAIQHVMAEARTEAERPGSFFSKSLRDALKRDEFDAPVRSIVRAIYEDWDGTLAARGSRHCAEGEAATSGHEFGLCLSVRSDELLEFDIHWRLPAIHDVGTFELKSRGATWRGRFEGAEGAVTLADSGQQDVAWRIAEEAWRASVPFQLVCRLGDESESTSAALELEKRLLWVLVPACDGPAGRACLREDVLPGYGPAFLLSPPGSVKRLQDYLEREEPPHIVLPAGCVPTGWMLVRLDECGSLTESQRTLPDGLEAHPRPRAIRFVGGRLVRRGYGRMYLPYDLPTVELDAPSGSTLRWPEGVEVVDWIGEQPQPGSTLLHPMRRFEIRLARSNGASYKFEAMVGGKVLGHATLRIAGTDGDVVEAGHPFSLDALGRPLPSSDGMSGVIRSSDATATREELAAIFQASPRDIGHGIAEAAPPLGVEENFLDYLAQRGGLFAGEARKLLARWLFEAGRSDNPVFVLMELRSRGHVEIATTHKGHMSRIHAVRPTLFPLPVACGGRRVYGLLGTLRRKHWEVLSRGDNGWTAHRRATDARLPAWRLVEGREGTIEAACAVGGALGLRDFRHAASPPMAIAKWSASLEVVRESALQNSMESIGRAADGALRFNAVKGRFTASPSGFPDELWKVRDLDTGFDNVHVLVDKGRHAFIRDSRWGVWISLDATAKHFKDVRGLDVHPVPLCYEAANGTIWLPASICLPVTLERALVLCSGAPPDVLDLTRGGHATNSERITLCRAGSPTAIASVSNFYQGMADGRWLAYRWVPIEVAGAVAGKLGARLDVA